MIANEKRAEEPNPLKEVVETVRDRLLDSADRLEKATQLAGSRAQVHLLQASNEARSVVHRFPLTSVLVAAGAGAVVGGVAAFLAVRRAGIMP